MPCKKCTLDQVPTGTHARVSKLCDCPKVRGRLCALGITPGTVVEVCAPRSIKVRESCLAISDEMACQVTCEPIEKPL